MTKYLILVEANDETGYFDNSNELKEDAIRWFNDYWMVGDYENDNPARHCETKVTWVGELPEADDE
jgi:hypothetical protein